MNRNRPEGIIRWDLGLTVRLWSKESQESQDMGDYDQFSPDVSSRREFPWFCQDGRVAR
jgi:hypothetical protein